MVKKLFYFIAIMILVAFIISQFVFGWRIAFINDSNDITKYFAVSAEKEEIELLILERKKMSTTCCLVIKCSSQEMLNNELFSLCDPEIYGFDYVDRVHNEYTSFCEKHTELNNYELKSNYLGHGSLGYSYRHGLFGEAASSYTAYWFSAQKNDEEFVVVYADIPLFIFQTFLKRNDDSMF